jgi:hypothetical protein
MVSVFAPSTLRQIQPPLRLHTLSGGTGICDHGGGILAGLVGHLRGVQIFLERFFAGCLDRASRGTKTEAPLEIGNPPAAATYGLIAISP